MIFLVIIVKLISDQLERGGGVSLYILDTLQYKLRNDLQLGGEVNSVFIEIFKASSNTKRNIVCGCVYRPPSMSLVKFNELLSHLFGKLQPENKYTYIMGDFNVNTLPHEPCFLYTQKLEF